MRKKAILFILIILMSIKINAQQYRLPNGESSFEISFGPSTLLIGDIGSAFDEKYIFDKNSPYHDPYKFINSYFSFAFHQELDEKFSYKIMVQASSYERPNPDKNNNYFLSDVFILTTRAEYNLFRVISPRENLMYIHAGAGVSYTNYTLKPRIGHTVKPIGITAPVIPVGIGYRLYLTDKVKIGADVNLHYIFSDLVEGRGAPIDNPGAWKQDILLSGGITLAYVIFEGNKAKNRCKCEWY
jgi:hypothetical protein